MSPDATLIGAHLDAALLAVTVLALAVAGRKARATVLVRGGARRRGPRRLARAGAGHRCRRRCRSQPKGELRWYFSISSGTQVGSMNRP
jgi:hypothetical protein